MIFGLIIMGIAVAVAAVAVALSLSEARKDADKNFSKKPVKKPCEACEGQQKDKIRLVELVEVVTRGGKEGTVVSPGAESPKKKKVYDRTDKNGGDFKQYINLKKDLEGASKRRPDYDRYIEVRARVEWVSGDKTKPLTGKRVFFKYAVDNGQKRPAGLGGGEKEGYDRAGGPIGKVATTDAEGWTPVVKFYLSQYGEDKFTVIARADEEDKNRASGPEKRLGKYQVWRKFWYQKTYANNWAAPDPNGSVAAYGKIFADMLASTHVTFSPGDAPKKTFYEEYQMKVGGGDDKQAVIGGHNRDWFYKKFREEKDKPVKVHLVLCQHQWDPAGTSGEVNVRVTSNPSQELPVPLGVSNGGIVKPALDGDVLVSGEWWVVDNAGNPVAEPEDSWWSKVGRWIGLWGGTAPAKVKGELKEENILIQKTRTALDAVHVKLPADAPDPTAKRVMVKFKVRYGRYWGGESNGYQTLIKCDVQGKYENIVSHEVGHAWFQTPDAGEQPASLGNHPNHYTNNQGGQGHHCSKGAALVMGIAGYPAGIYSDGDCTMYHSVARTDGSFRSEFCDVCEPYMKLWDMSKLKQPT